jgi:hypothetical protein
MNSIERLRDQVRNSKDGYCHVRTHDLQLLLRRHDGKDNTLERLENAVAALLLDIEAGATISDRSKGQHRAKSEAWASYMQVSHMIDRLLKDRRERRKNFSKGLDS